MLCRAITSLRKLATNRLRADFSVSYTTRRDLSEATASAALRSSERAVVAIGGGRFNAQGRASVVRLPQLLEIGSETC